MPVTYTQANETILDLLAGTIARYHGAWPVTRTLAVAPGSPCLSTVAASLFLLAFGIAGIGLIFASRKD